MRGLFSQFFFEFIREHNVILSSYRHQRNLNHSIDVNGLVLFTDKHSEPRDKL